MVMLIDPPSPLDPPEAWSAFLAELMKLPTSPDVERHILEARRAIDDGPGT
jgi:hypothetical protein